MTFLHSCVVPNTLLALYGFPGRIDRIREICDKHGALLVEDITQAIIIVLNLVLSLIVIYTRGLNYDKYFKDGEAERNTLTEFNSNNTRRLNLEETKAIIASLSYIQERLAEVK